MNDAQALLQQRLTKENYDKLMAIDCPKMHAFVADAIALTNPATVYVVTDAQKDLDAIRELAKQPGGGEHPLAMEGHTYHLTA